MVAAAPLEVGSRPAVLLGLTDAAGEPHEIAARIEVRTCRQSEWLRGRRPAAPLPESEAIVVALDHYRDRGAIPLQPSIPALRQA